MTNRIINESEEHDKTVGLTAKTRFNFPNSDNPTWKTYTNHPEQTKGVSKGNDTCYPDIVVVDEPKNALVMIGEVETSITVSDDEASREWQNYASLGKTFYLYVPNDLVAKAKKLLNKYKIKIAGLRGYFYDANGELNIQNQ